MQRVDFAVMGEHSEGLGQPPRREGVGAVALMIDDETADEALVVQVRVEDGQILGQEHALVDQAAARKGAEIELGDLRGDGLLLDLPADDVQVALISGVIMAGRVPDQDLFDLGRGGAGLVADDGGVDRHLAPAIDGISGGEDFRLANLAAPLLGAEIGLGEKHHADRDTAGLERVAAEADSLGKEILRDLHVDAGAVARLAVGVHRAAVPDGAQGIDAGLHDFAAGCAVERCHETDAAGIVLSGVDVGVCQGGQIGSVGGGEFGAGFHGGCLRHRFRQRARRLSRSRAKDAAGRRRIIRRPRPWTPRNGCIDASAPPHPARRECPTPRATPRARCRRRRRRRAAPSSAFCDPPSGCPSG